MDDTAPWMLRARDALEAGARQLAARFDAGEETGHLLGARAAAVDAVLVEAWARHVPENSGLALFAVGGYGRGELYPQSDIDLMVLAGEGAQARHADALGRLFASLWDIGLPASHAVRTREECTQAARDDITVMTALMEARALVADAAAVAALAQVLAEPSLWPAREYFLAKREEQRQRHARYGGTADNLEPSIKGGPGGLRDIQAVRWMALRIFGVRDLQSLVAIGQISRDESATLEREHRVLSRLRFGLHLVAGKPEERLRFDYQKALAARRVPVPAAQAHALPCPSTAEGEHGNRAVETMMQSFYRSAALVQRMTARLVQRFEEQLDGPAEMEPVNAEFALRRGYLMARDEVWPGGDMLRVFDLFACWAERPQVERLDSHTARALAESLHALPAYSQASPALREAFMQLLRGPAPVPTLERMARTGVLGRWIPAFAEVAGRMQFDLFHAYTVDQHTLMVLRHLAAFAAAPVDARFAEAHAVWPQLPRPELLLLAGLFHDIGKGRGGDHSELGARDARAFCQAHGLPASDAALVEWLVRHHLVMSTTAQKQDISDPEVIARFARVVGDRERLDYLYLLTCADIAGTSPTLWNAWKDRLLTDLRSATRLALRRGLEHPQDAAARIADQRAHVTALLAEEAGLDVAALLARMPPEAFLRARADLLAWQARALHASTPGGTVVRLRRIHGAGDALDVFVSAPDRDGLFAAIVMTLDRLGLDIVQARALDGPDGNIFDTFQVLPRERRTPPEPVALERALAAVLAGDLNVSPARHSQPQHLRHFRVRADIGFNPLDGADGQYTVMSIVCTDRPGLLAAIANVLRGEAIRVHEARIATFGARAEDVFRITNGHNQPLDEAACQRLHAHLSAILDGEPH